jgi:hypothetical protein
LKPVDLGNDVFFLNIFLFEWLHTSQFSWTHRPGENIKIPKGEILVDQESYEGRSIDVKLCEQVHQAEEIGKERKGGKRKQQLIKLHKYFGHASADSLWRVIKNSTNKEEYTLAELQEIYENCDVCNHSKRKMFKKKTSLPRSTGFNQVVTMDLKCNSDGTYILWLVDDATRMIRGQVVNDKKPETIIDALEAAWVNGRGIGPGMPEKYFFCDNGGEFINDKMMGLAQRAGINIKKTSSFSPQQNGLNERNHGIADIMVEKIRRESPKMKLQDAIDQATWARNSLIIPHLGFSPFQMVYGRNPSLPGVSDATTGGLETMTESEIVKAMFHRMENTRIQWQIAEHDHRMKIAMKDRLPKETNIAFGIGDDITFRDRITKKLYDGRIVGFEGPTALIKWGNSDRRVPTRELLPRRQRYQDSDTDTEPEGKTESEEETIPEIRPTRRGPKRKKKAEIIPEISAFKIKKPKSTEKYIEGTPLPDLWTEDEKEDYTKKVEFLTMPKKGVYIKMWNLKGEKFSGKVIQCRKTHFFIIETGTNHRAWIDLNRLNYWEYLHDEEIPAENINQGENGNQSTSPSLMMLESMPYEYEAEDDIE